MLSVAYGRQILTDGGQIDNLKASQRQMQGCADRTCPVSASSLLSEDPVIEIESDPIFHAEQRPTGDRR